MKMSEFPVPSEEPFSPEEDDGVIEEAMDRLEVAERRQEALQTFLTKAMQGELSRHRPLRYWENLRLKPRHLQMILMCASGYKNQEIAQQMGMTEARVSVILNHPDAKMLLSQLVSYASENLLDVKTRIAAHAGEALDTVLHVMRNSRDDRVRSHSGFELLKMAGYGAVQETKVKVEGSIDLAAPDAKRIASALEESRDIEDADFEIYIEKPAKTQLPPSQSHEDEGKEEVA